MFIENKDLIEVRSHNTISEFNLVLLSHRYNGSVIDFIDIFVITFN